MRQYEWVQSQWTNAKKHTHRKPGDFWNLTNLYPTPDRQQLRRSPGFGAWTQWGQNFRYPAGAFYNAALVDSAYYNFIGQDSDTSDLAIIVYEGAGWNTAVTYSTIYDLTTTDSRLRGLHNRNQFLWYSQDLIYIAHADQDVYKSTNLGAGAQIYDGAANPKPRILVPHGDTLYLICETGEIWASNADITGFTQIYSPSPMQDFQYAIAQGHYLLLFAFLEPGTIQLYNLPLPNAEILLPIDTIPNVPGWTPVADASRNHHFPWASDGENVYLTSGLMPEFDKTRVEIYRYNGSRIQPIAQDEDLANVTSLIQDFGLMVWKGELLMYQYGNGVTWLRMLVGDEFVDFVDLTATSPLTANQDGFGGFYNLAGRLWLTCKSGSNYGFMHQKGYSDGNLETSYLDMDKPGHLKRLHRLTTHVQNHAAGVTVTIKYKLDDDTSWTTAVATANADRIVLDNIAVDFYRLKLRVEIADTGATPTDTRIDSISARYTA